MQVTATVESFAGKGAAIAAIRQARWACGETDFDGLLALYNSGHIINISDKAVSEAFIVDVDAPKTPSGPSFERLPRKEQEAKTQEYESALEDYRKRVASLDDPAYLSAISGKIGAEYGVCLQSSSRDPLRRKVFFRIRYGRNIKGGDNPDGGHDLEGRRLRELFENATGIKADPKMDRAAQVTFGCRISDACPINVSAWTPCPQPTNADYGCTAGKRKKAAQNTQKLEAAQALPASDAPFQFVPLNMGAYNHRYGKQIREGGRLEWNAYRYDQAGGKIVNAIPIGSRHSTVPRIVSAIVWNAIHLNRMQYTPLCGEHTPFTLDDCMGTLKKIIIAQFDSGEAFWDEEGSDSCALLAAAWDEFANIDIDDAYKALCARSHEKERRMYIPRDIGAIRIYHHCLADLRAFTNYSELKDFIGFISDGDARRMAALLRLCRKDPNIISGRGRGGCRQTNFIAYLGTCPQDDAGRYLVSRTQYNKKAFRDYCREHGYAIKKAY